MRQAVAWHRQSKTKKSLGAINKAIAARPKDPYFHELKGQILMESRQFKAATAAYARATNLAPNNPLILGSYGRALLTQGQVKKAQQILEKTQLCR